MKRTAGISLLFLFFACNQTLQFEFPKSEKLVFCQCLFSSESDWKVKVANTYTFGDQEFDNGIDDAKVFVVDEENDTIQLTHYRNGEYRSENCKPKEGIYYQLFVIVNSDTLSSSKSCVPSGIELEVIEMDENPGSVKVDYYTMDDVYAIRCKVNLEKAIKQGVLIRTFLYDSLMGVETYTFNNNVYDSIYMLLKDSSVINQLQYLNGDTLYGFENIEVVVKNLLHGEVDYPTIEKVVQASYCGRLTDRREEAFQKISCYSGNTAIKSFQYEDKSLLGIFMESSFFDVYVWSHMEGDYLIEFKALSPEAYQYYEDYISQLNGRVDYTTVQEPVYSNITNGVGIFAGYSEKMVHVK